MKRFDTSYYDDFDYESLYGPQPAAGFDTIADAIEWNEKKGIDLYLVHVTEWDIEGETDAYGNHEIVGKGNLQDYEN